MPVISWKDIAVKLLIKKAALDGIEEWCNAAWLPQARADCPVDSGTMRNSLGVERDNAGQCCYVGGGGAASSYIMKQELDRSLSHTIGKAGFIEDSVTDNMPSVNSYVKKHVK
jgi:hypothetical protein